MGINSFDDVINKTNLKAFVRTDDLVEGKNYKNEDIVLVNKKEIPSINVEIYYFEVESLSLKTYYDVDVYISNKQTIKQVHCDCKEFRYKHSCSHISAVFYNYYDVMFGNDKSLLLQLSNNILNTFAYKESKHIKKQLNLELVLSFEDANSYYYYNSFDRLLVKVMIGEDKLYVLGNKTNVFRNAIMYNEQVNFGKKFTYDPDIHFFSEEAKTILDAYFALDEYGNLKYYQDRDLKKFLNRIKDCHFIIENYEVDGIIEGFYIATDLDKNNDNYRLTFDLDNVKPLIYDDYEYILYKGKVYHLNKKHQKLLSTLFDNDIDSLLITEDKFNLFTNGLLSTIKNNLNTSIDNLYIPKDIKTEIYFDLDKGSITAKPKFIYDGNIVEYFDKDSKVLRDMDYETGVINDILKYGFMIEAGTILLSDLELIVEFMEQGLEVLAEKYAIFTTEKFKSSSIKKKTNVTSMFSIGRDNILSYDFNLQGINSNELVNIFKNIKNKKKYYRLKNGDILNLQDEALQELENLSEDLELTDDDIRNGKGSILKYRAIYLDSLKNNKYNIISTDNLFDQFIDRFYRYKDVDLTLSDLSILRDYQITGVKWLYNLAKTGLGGILADEMGLGKTIQVIYYIKQMLLDDPSALFLIVVPTSLAYNWDNEFNKYANEIKRYICVGNKDKRKNMLNNLKDINVIVTTYGLLREDEELYSNKVFNTMIIDEAQNIKNTMAGITKVVKKINAEVKFALTGTPLENSVLELWSIFDFIMPGYLASLTKFQSKYRIKDFNEDSDILLKGLSKQINPFILRRKKNDVIKELPDKIENNIYIELNDEQKKLYVAELERVKEEMNNLMATEGMSKARFMILQLLTKLRQICIDPKIVYDEYRAGSNKIDTLVSIVNEYSANGHKILIFSSFRTALNIVKDRLDEEKIKYYTIDGSVSSKARMQMVDSFNDSDDVKVFLIMLKSGGTGLNLASANVVIHLDLWWNPQAENQATDRAHRIGQKDVVEVIRLITKGTIEEKILELQNKKKILSDKLIDGERRDKNILSELTKEDIQNLLSYENED